MNTNQTIAELEAEIINSNKNTHKLKLQLLNLKKQQGKQTVDKKALRAAQRAARYTTENGLTIHKLRLAGNSVKVTHIRYTAVEGKRVEYKDGVKYEVPFVTYQPVPSYLRKVVDFDGKGGCTYIVITTPEKQVYSVSSHCHELDAFDYKLGVKYALDLLTEAEAKILLSGAPVDAKPVSELAAH